MTEDLESHFVGRATVGLGHDAKRADLDAPEMLDGGEGEHHGVTPLANLQGLFPGELLMFHRQRVEPLVDSSLQVVRQLGRGERVNRRTQLTEVVEVAVRLVEEIFDAIAES